jgi:DNA-binding response OmpR family regulator
MVFDYLSSQGYDVAIVMNGEDAVTKSQTLAPDLMIVDVLLPKKNGFNVCLEVNRLSANSIPILVMSAIYNDDTARTFVENDLHAAGFLRKPFKLKELLQRVRAVFNPDEV